MSIEYNTPYDAGELGDIHVCHLHEALNNRDGIASITSYVGDWHRQTRKDRFRPDSSQN